MPGGKRISAAVTRANLIIAPSIWKDKEVIVFSAQNRHGLPHYHDPMLDTTYVRLIIEIAKLDVQEANTPSPKKDFFKRDKYAQIFLYNYVELDAYTGSCRWNKYLSNTEKGAGLHSGITIKSSHFIPGKNFAYHKFPAIPRQQKSDSLYYLNSKKDANNLN